jgi:hypothetical protein
MNSKAEKVGNQCQSYARSYGGNFPTSFQPRIRVNNYNARPDERSRPRKYMRASWRSCTKLSRKEEE